MRDAIIVFPHARDQFELQAMGVSFTTEPRRAAYGTDLVAEVKLDNEAMALVDEHLDRFGCVYRSDLPEVAREMPYWRCARFAA